MDEEGEDEEDEEEGPRRTSTSNPHRHSKGKTIWILQNNRVGL